MQIQGISSMSGMPNMQPPESTPLTDDQKSTLEEILAQYDLENLTDEQLQEIHDQMDEAGIQRSRETMEIMTQAGLDFSTMTPPDKQGPPPSQGEGLSISATADAQGLLSGTTSEGSTLMSLISQLQSGEASEEDVQSYIDQLKQALSNSLGNLIDQYI